MKDRDTWPHPRAGSPRGVPDSGSSLLGVSEAGPASCEPLMLAGLAGLGILGLFDLPGYVLTWK